MPHLIAPLHSRADCRSILPRLFISARTASAGSTSATAILKSGEAYFSLSVCLFVTPILSSCADSSTAEVQSSFHPFRVKFLILPLQSLDRCVFSPSRPAYASSMSDSWWWWSGVGFGVFSSFFFRFCIHPHHRPPRANQWWCGYPCMGSRLLLDIFIRRPAYLSKYCPLSFLPVNYILPCSGISRRYVHHSMA